MSDAIAQVVAGFEQTWSLSTVVVAVLAGIGVGWAILGQLAADTTYASPTLTPRQVGVVVVWTGLAAGLAFYVGQTVASAADGDFAWPRIVGRYGLWVLYAFSLGIGSYFRLRRHLAAKQAQAEHRAHVEIEGPDA